MRVAVGAAFLAFAATVGHAFPVPLIEPGSVTVSGLSSGADMAIQLQVAFSQMIRGTAAFAGQPYRCAVTRFPGEQQVPMDQKVPYCEGCDYKQTVLYDHCKNNPNIVDLDVLSGALSLPGIDDVRHLRDAKIFLHQGRNDHVCLQGSVNNTHNFFSRLVADAAQVKTITTGAGHAVPTASEVKVFGFLSVGCFPDNKLLQSYFYQQCGLDGYGEALKHLYGSDAFLGGTSEFNSSYLYDFDQKPFQTAENYLELTGKIYIPKACEQEQCKLMLNMHGGGLKETFWSNFVAQSGLLRWAANNKLVVLFPRLGLKDGHWNNDGHNWDVYGYSGQIYSTKHAPQMLALQKMIELLVLAPAPTPIPSPAAAAPTPAGSTLHPGTADGSFRGFKFYYSGLLLLLASSMFHPVGGA